MERDTETVRVEFDPVQVGKDELFATIAANIEAYMGQAPTRAVSPEPPEGDHEIVLEAPEGSASKITEIQGVTRANSLMIF